MARKIRDERPVLIRIFVIAVFIVVVGAFALLKFSDSREGTPEKIALAKCLSESGAKMYGTYWCPSCSKQKKRFGKSWSHVDYVECALPGRPRDQAQECIDAGIIEYPTWVFGDGSRLSGEFTLQDLAEKTGCEDALNPPEQVTAPAGESWRRFGMDDATRLRPIMARRMWNWFRLWNGTMFVFQSYR